MFANPIWSLLLVALVIVYLWYIRPKLKAQFAKQYAAVDGVFECLRARLYVWHTPIVTAIGMLLIAAPDLLVQVSSMDFSGILPQPWAGYVSPVCLMLIALFKAFPPKSSTGG